MNAPALNENRDISFLYLNRDGRWRDFEWRGLRLADGAGALTLATVPLAPGATPAPPADDQTSDGLGGVAIGPDGAAYFSDSARNRISKIDPCDNTAAPAPCVGGAGRQPAQFLTPRGLMFHPQRRALFVADSGNHRIQIFAIDTLQLLGVWGQPDFFAEPKAGSEDGLFNDPRSLAVDGKGNVYVVDYGNRRTQKFDLCGRVAPEFSRTLEAELERRHLQLRQPSEVAVNLRGEATEIYLLDQDSKSVFVFDEDGHYLEQLDLKLSQPAGLAVKGDALYVGAWERQSIFKFERRRLKGDAGEQEWTRIGEAQGFRGRTAALALTAKNDLWVHPGGDGVPSRLVEDGGYVKRGFLWGGPFNNPSVRRDQLRALRATADLPPGAHLRLFIYSTSGDDAPPAPASPDVPPWDGHSDDLSMSLTAPRSPGRWRSLPLDTKEFLIPGAPSDRVWVGCELIGEGLASPTLSQMRLDVDRETYLRFLPPIYRENAQSADLLARFLALFESLFVEIETEIRGLAGLFDPRSAPPEFLSWLAGWLAFEVAEKWDEERKREAIARAFELYAKRGTVEGLRESLRFFAGVEARVEEPLLQAEWWALPADEDAPDGRSRDSLLGFTTMLVASEAQGAVVGATATLDQSHLITEEEFGAPLFDDLAHRFTVQLYRGASFSEETLETVRALIDREKPAHTDARLCVIEPNLRVGFQSRVGIDTIVAGRRQPASLASATSAGTEFVLGGEPAGRIGQLSDLGRTTRLGFRPFEAEHSERDCDSE